MNEKEAPSCDISTNDSLNKNINSEKTIQILENKESQRKFLLDNYPTNICGELECNFLEDEIIEPDILIEDENGNNKYVFFNLNKLKNKLESIYNNSLKKNPFIYDNIKEDIENFYKISRTDEFKERELGIFEKIGRFFYYWGNSKILDKKNKIKAKKSGLYLSNLNNYLKNPDKKNLSIVATLDQDLKTNINLEEIPNLDKIFNDIEEIRDSDIYEFISKLDKKTKELLKDIENSKELEKIISIQINYLIYRLDEKLIKKEELKKSIPYESLKIMFDLRSLINKKVIEYGIKREKKKKLFFGKEFKNIKIIRDTINEKKIFLDSGNLDKFLLDLEKEIRTDSNLILLNIKGEKTSEEKESENQNFIENLLNKIDKLDDLDKQCDLEINKLTKSEFDNIVDTGVGIESLVENSIQPKININDENDKNEKESKNGEKKEIIVSSLKKTGTSIIDIKKNREDIKKYEKIKKNLNIKKEIITNLFNEYKLKREINDSIKNGSGEILGIIINQEIKDPSDHKLDKFTCDKVY